jgi:hypothetical protein
MNTLQGFLPCLIVKLIIQPGIDVSAGPMMRIQDSFGNQTLMKSNAQLQLEGQGETHQPPPTQDDYHAAASSSQIAPSRPLKSLNWRAFSEFPPKPISSPHDSRPHTLSPSDFSFFFSPKLTHTHHSRFPPLNKENFHHFLPSLLLFSLLSSTLEPWDPWHM